MNILVALSHAIEEYQQLLLLHELGYGVCSIGGYIDPGHPHDDKRPALPQIPVVPSIKAAVDALGTNDNLGAAQAHIPDAALEWLGDDGIIIFHHHLWRLFGQWPRIRDWLNGSSRRRVIWRSVGQSVESNENEARPFRADGLERVAYSPKEANIPGYTDHDALIRFWADPAEYGGWTGEDATVLNIAQHHGTAHGRDEWLNWAFWEEVTRPLPRAFAGTHSELVGGLGQLTFDAMKDLLRASRAYLYTGTQPASYTLGLIEAMMTGIPVVSIGPAHMRIFSYGHLLFEGHELVSAQTPEWHWHPWADDPALARGKLEELLASRSYAAEQSAVQRARAIELFGKAHIAAEWRAFLG